MEPALHTLVVLVHPPLLLSAVAIAISSTTLAVWIVEPAVMRTLGSWLHAPGATTADERAPNADAGTTQTGPGRQAVVLDRPGDPVTPAESARAHLLAGLARPATSLGARIRRTAPPPTAPGPHGAWRS
jgi:hypothetical protein